MRMTINVPERLGQEARQTANDQSISVSRLVAEALSIYLRSAKRRQLGHEVLSLAGNVEVAEDALDSLADDRADDRT